MWVFCFITVCLAEFSLSHFHAYSVAFLYSSRIITQSSKFRWYGIWGNIAVIPKNWTPYLNLLKSVEVNCSLLGTMWERWRMAAVVISPPWCLNNISGVVFMRVHTAPFPGCQVVIDCFAYCISCTVCFYSKNNYVVNVIFLSDLLSTVDSKAASKLCYSLASANFDIICIRNYIYLQWSLQVRARRTDP